jgi:hypothetical protein
LEYYISSSLLSHVKLILVEACESLKYDPSLTQRIHELVALCSSDDPSPLASEEADMSDKGNNEKEKEAN